MLTRAHRNGLTATGRAPLADRKDDLYETPLAASEALLREENLPGTIWEPACGPGAIVRVLRAAGHRVIASDLVEYGCPDATSRVDFLMETPGSPLAAVDAIVTNPPFKLAGRFVAHALTLCPRVYALLRLAFLESEGRTAILDSGQLARVLVFKNRLPRMHRAGYDGPQSSSSIAFAWFVWDRDHSGPTELRRVSWK